MLMLNEKGEYVVVDDDDIYLSEPTPLEPTIDERVKAAEDALLVLMGGGM